MKTKIPLLICLSTICSSLMGQTLYSDTTDVRELHEVVVEAKNQRTSATASTYVPLARQKNSATDAVSLLSQMAIPQLEVNPANSSIKTISGQAVSIFIDYVAATSQDLSGMQPKDVKKIEYLLNPKDPRFRGAQYVVNFVMHKYEWGGYTKINANKWFGVNRSEGSVYSKFAYKAMTFDIFANEIYLTDRHSGIKSTETFHFPDLYGEGPRTVERTSTPVSSLYMKNTNDVTFRALYASEKAQVSNMLSFNNTANPHNDSENALSYTNGFMDNSRSNNRASNHSWGLNYDFGAYTSFNPYLAMNVEAAYRFSHNKSNSLYSDNELQIVNDASEDAHFINMNPCLVWTPNDNNSIMPYMYGEYSRTGIDYYGNSPSHQNYDIWGYMAGLKYTYNQEKWSAGGQAGWVYANTNLSGTKVTDNYPQGNVFGTYSPNSQHQFEFTYHFGKTVPDTYQKSPNMLQQDALMWYTGTPDLKNYWNHRIGLEYVWLPNNKWQLAADSYYLTERNRVVTTYTPNAPDGVILRQYVNNGDYDNFMAGLSSTAKFLNGKLVAKVRPQYWHRRVTGAYNLALNEMTCSAQLTWYFGNFYLFGWYMTPSTYIGTDGGSKESSPSSYQIQLSWGKGSWRVSATAYNFLRSSWETSKQTLNSTYYQFDRRIYGTSEHRRFQLAVAYTFGYGKRVQRGNEVSGTGPASSAILK